MASSACTNVIGSSVFAARKNNPWAGWSQRSRANWSSRSHRGRSSGRGRRPRIEVPRVASMFSPSMSTYVVLASSPMGPRLRPSGPGHDVQRGCGYFFPRSMWFFASALACFSARFSLIDLLGFLLMLCRGDLSAMSCSQREGTWTAPSTDTTPPRAENPSGVLVVVGVVGVALVALTGAEQRLQLGLDVGGRDEQQLVEWLERVVPAGCDRVAFADDAGEHRVPRERHVTDARPGIRAADRQGHLDHHRLALLELEDSHQVADADGLLDQGGHQARRRHGDVDAP